MKNRTRTSSSGRLVRSLLPLILSIAFLCAGCGRNAKDGEPTVSTGAPSPAATASEPGSSAPAATASEAVSSAPAAPETDTPDPVETQLPEPESTEALSSPADSGGEALPSESTSPELSQDERDMALIQEFLAQQPLAEVYAYRHLPSGGVFVALIDRSGYWHDDINDRDLVSMDFYIVEPGEHGLSFHELGEWDWDADKIYIFYDEDWEMRVKGAYDGCTTNYESGFSWHIGESGEEAIIFVFPNLEYPAYNTGIPKVEYRLSPFYQMEPSDSLGTVPVSLQYEGWNDDYPAWVFVVDREDIDAGYELHYMDYVLTGSELLNNSWRIGNATPIEQYIAEWIHQSEEEEESGQAEWVNPNDPEIVDEEIAGIQQALEQLRSLWEEHREELEPIAREMLDLNHIFIEETGDTGAYYPAYSIQDGIRFSASRVEFSEEVRQRVGSLEKTLEACLPEWGILYADVEGEGWHRIADSEIAAFWVSLYNPDIDDSDCDANSNYCEAALCCSKDPNAAAMPYFEVEWLDDHWFLYYEWKE